MSESLSMSATYYVILLVQQDMHSDTLPLMPQYQTTVCRHSARGHKCRVTRCALLLSNAIKQHVMALLVRLVKTGTGKPVNRFTTGTRFSECITGYRIYCTSCRHDPGNANTLRCRECHQYPLFSRNSSNAVTWQLLF